MIRLQIVLSLMAVAFITGLEIGKYHRSAWDFYIAAEYRLKGIRE